MKKLKLINSSRKAIVDDNVFSYLNQFKWKLNSNLETPVRSYVCCNNRNDKIKPFPEIARLDVYLHRLIFDKYAQSKFYVDHINGNTLDNRLCNLRFATNQQNQANSKISKNNKSGYKGVSWDKENKKWISQIMFNHKNIKLGRFTSRQQAHRVYCQAGERLFGGFFRKR